MIHMGNQSSTVINDMKASSLLLSGCPNHWACCSLRRVGHIWMGVDFALVMAQLGICYGADIALLRILRRWVVRGKHTGDSPYNRADGFVHGLLLRSAHDFSEGGALFGV